MRRFEFSEGKSNKFWEIEVEGSGYTTRHGRIGSSGKATSKSFASAALAQKKADAAIASKLAKGYVEVDGAAVPEASAVDDSPIAKLERTLIDQRDDLDSWSVYADALEGAGDARGQLVALYVARARGQLDAKTFKTNEKQLIASHAAAWFGKFVSEDDWRECFGWTFAMGHWGRIRLWVDDDHDGTDIAKALAYALAHPSAKFLRELDLGLPSADGSGDYGPCIAALAKHGRLPSLRRLHIGDFRFPDESEISWVTVGNIGELWPRLVGLEHLTLQGAGIRLGNAKSTTLRRLELLSGGLLEIAGHALGKAELPALEQLEVWFGTTYYGGSCSAEHARGILQNPSFGRLRELGLKNADFADDIAAVVASTPLPATLTSLDLSMGTMTDAGGERLLGAAAALAGLERIDLSRNYLSAAMCRRLRAALPNARLDDQRDDGGEHYVSVGE